MSLAPKIKRHLKSARAWLRAAIQRPHRVKTPTVLQMEAVECGAASLAIVLGYHGKFVPLEELRIACGVSRDGSKASNIVKAAREYGLQANGYKKEPEALHSLPLPMIVFWNFNHFLVVEGFGRERVYLNDPATGPRVVSAEEFDQSFTGVVLTFDPTADFQPGEKPPGLWRALRKRLVGSESGLLYVLLASLALAIPGLLIPTFLRVFVDYILVAGFETWLEPLLIGMLITAFLRGAFTWLQQYHLLRFESKLSLSASSQFLWRLLCLPVEFYTQRFGGELGARIAINDQIARLLSGELATAALNLVTIAFYALVMLFYDIPLTLISILIATLNFVALRYILRKRVDANRKLVQGRGKMLGTAMGGLQMIETLKVGGSETAFFARWAGYQARAVNAQQELELYSRVLSAVPTFLMVLNTTAILFIGSSRVMRGSMSIGTLVAFQSLMISFIEPVNNLVNLGSLLQEVQGDVAWLDDVLRYQVDERVVEQMSPHSPTPPPHVPPNPLGEKIHRPEREYKLLVGELEVRDLSFGYNHMAPPLIQDFSLKLDVGARVALVGETGSGKSTIAKIVCGLYKPWEGQVLLDGMPRDKFSRHIITNSLASVDQDIFLFEGSVRDNLTLWDTTIPETELIQAAKDASIHTAIMARPGGYDSLVEEGGRNFSGGERQRMEIARALVCKPSILVLDEATSALDPSTEALIDNNLRRRGCTCLIIAHRLSTIRDCDEIIVLEQGQVVQRGTHASMMRAGGPYAELIKSETLKDGCLYDPASCSLVNM